MSKQSENVVFSNVRRKSCGTSSHSVWVRNVLMQNQFLLRKFTFLVREFVWFCRWVETWKKVRLVSSQKT